MMSAHSGNDLDAYKVMCRTDRPCMSFATVVDYSVLVTGTHKNFVMRARTVVVRFGRSVNDASNA